MKHTPPPPSPQIIVVLVEPKYGGNIGSVARVMMNFDYHNLFLVNPCDFDDECYMRAMHATSILENAQTFSTFEEALKKIDYCVATSSIASKSDKRHLRKPITLEQLTTKLPEVKGTIGLVFGREDYGLYNEEIAQCDIMLQIPTSDAYPSLNLSHAVAIVLHTLYVNQNTSVKKPRQLGRLEKEKLNEFFAHLLDEIQYPDHKKENTKIMLKRILGRAMPSTWEYHTLMGVVSKTLDQLKRKKR